jgi:integrase
VTCIGASCGAGLSASTNPARSPKIELPRVARDELIPPSAAHLDAILQRVPRRLRLGLVTAEQAALRVSEVQHLEWGSVDEDGSRLRVSKAKGGRTRWAPVPAWLMDVVAASCPREDRTSDRRVFQGFNDDTARASIARACIAAGIPHFTPHDLRHRRISLWHGQGVPVKAISERVGHARASMTLDTYSHVMPLEELPVSRYLELLKVEASAGAYPGASPDTGGDAANRMVERAAGPVTG